MYKLKIASSVAGLMLSMFMVSTVNAAEQAATPPIVTQKPLTLTAADGVKVYGTYYQTANPSAPLILLFHQADSNRYEYEPMVPRLAAVGFNLLAIDQRSGGTLWGHDNQTVAGIGKSADYLDALPDLQAALDWAHAAVPARQVIVWGSSYSSSLVFILAAKNPGEVSGLLAFSPGEYFPDPHMVHDAAAKLHMPVFVTSAAADDEIAAAKTLLTAVASSDQDKVQFVPAVGVHGSKTLREDKDPKGAEANWQAVLKFLGRILTKT